MRRIGLLLAVFAGLLQIDIQTLKAGVIFSDNFNNGASPLWGDEIGSWSAAGGVYGATIPSNFPNAHSSLPFDLTDFTVDVDVNKLRDGGIWLRSTEEPGTTLGIEGVLLVTGGNSGTGTGLYWHIVTDGSTYGSEFNPVNGLFISGVSDAHIQVVVSGDTYSAYVDGATTPATTLTTSAFSSGGVGLYDFSTQTFDNFVVSTPSAVPEPSSLSLISLGIAGSLVGVFAVRTKRKRSVS